MFRLHVLSSPNAVHADDVLFTLGFFFFKQKTAYEIMPSLVGSEMCIRDSKNNLVKYLIFFF